LFVIIVTYLFSEHLWSDSVPSSSSLSRAGPYWSIAASTVHRHCSRSCDRLHVAFRPMLSALRSFSTVRVQVHLGRPGGRLQLLGRPDMTVLMLADTRPTLIFLPDPKIFGT